jgi:hypothetical protein
MAFASFPAAGATAARLSALSGLMLLLTGIEPAAAFRWAPIAFEVRPLPSAAMTAGLGRPGPKTLASLQLF